VKLETLRPIDDPAVGAGSTVWPANTLLAQLPSKTLAELLRLSKRIELEPGRRLYEANDAHPPLYFPGKGAIGLIGLLPTGETLQIALVDSRGVAGISGLDGESHLPCEAVVQLPGWATCVPFDAFTTFRQNPATANVFCSYLFGLAADAMQSALCHTFHTVEQRCALWLLKLCDVAGPNFFITQEQLSGMLGVRRASITLAALAFHSRGAIEYRYGAMVIRNRVLLQQSACACYHADLLPERGAA
jgi:CRP-like cAMP-binding protein